eukprot:scaffold48060_cov64-Phaeocystis_antarctica.AAC.2
MRPRQPCQPKACFLVSAAWSQILQTRSPALYCLARASPSAPEESPVSTPNGGSCCTPKLVRASGSVPLATSCPRARLSRPERPSPSNADPSLPGGSTKGPSRQLEARAKCSASTRGAARKDAPLELRENTKAAPGCRLAASTAAWPRDFKAHFVR